MKQVSGSSEVDERFAALITNSSAVRAIASAVEGTIGPKGLDTMLVDRFGEVVITNDGITILTRMEVTHPAARMVIGTARAQEEEVGDGTTTTMIMTGALLSEGVAMALKGVPITKVIEGIRLGIDEAVKLTRERSRSVASVDDPRLGRVALIAGREHKDLAELVTRAVRMLDPEKLTDPAFRLADTVVAEEGADNDVLSGLIIKQTRMNRQMPAELSAVRLIIVDDALEPEEVEEEALGTEAGFNMYLEFQEQFKRNLAHLVQLGVNCVLVDRGVSDVAEELLTDAGIMVLERVSAGELRRVAEHTGARPIKRTGLKKLPVELERYVGTAETVQEDERLEHIRLLGGGGKPIATILVGAATEEVVDERERIARDAAASVQAAFRGGIVPGGGALEVSISREIDRMTAGVKGMSSYGVLCVVEALKRPLAQIVSNAGFNALEKLGDVLAAPPELGDCVGIDCDTGELRDMEEAGVLDPTEVKIHALNAAGEIAEAILRINMIIKKREDGEHAGVADNDAEF